MAQSTAPFVMPATAKERARHVAGRFTAIIDGFTEAQCLALEETGILIALNKGLLAIRAGQIVGGMSVTDFLQTLASIGKK